MSDKRPGERDIDEILASIDEMLSQKQPYTLQDDGRKDSVKEGVKASEDTLGLSSSVDLPDLSEFDQVDIDEFLSLGMPEKQPETQSKTDKHNEDEHKAEDFNTETQTQSETNIQAGADIAHGTNQDAALDIEQAIDEDINFTLDEMDLPDFDESLASNQEANTDEQDTATPEISDSDAMALSPEESQLNASANTDDMIEDDLDETDSDEGSLDEVDLDEGALSEPELNENDLDENSVDENILADEPEAEDNMPRHRILLTEELLEPSAQEALPLWIEQTSNDEEILEQDNDTVNQQKPAAESTPAEDFDKKAAKVDAKTQETETAETSQQPTNDVDMQPNTANADVPADDSANQGDKPASADGTTDLNKNDTSVFDLEEGMELDTVYKLETLTSDTEDDLDNHTELVEVMMEEVLQNDEEPADEEQAENSGNEPEKATEKVFLNDDELQHMVQVVSADVAQQIDDHLQTWLPGLISIAIKNHIKDLNNKD